LTNKALQIISIEAVMPLLEDEVDVSVFDAAVAQLETDPALIDSLIAAQLARDALHGNPAPDRNYTLRIMKFIADAESTPDDDGKSVA
jgi:hypothetical protein